ncbi:PBP1 and LysM peptidoglycan-binding domain-containing protein [Mesonia aquimarina]|uniref:PBP1 and LysM peptidoglycan-binding domain-containing protein n=1 Tax=Mesonia aquimarina TaxID=1504967 RepID=UPI000EF5C7AE|nr:LysM peptidoglycan-binding domain-containing protein [Mesonia aquimarina]
MKKILVFLVVVNFFSTIVLAQNYKTHRVQQGETIAEIAKKYEVTEAAIYKLNPDAKNGNILATVLVIPYGETPDGVSGSNVLRFKEYEVEAKGTLYSIAKDNNISVEDLKKYNPYLYEEELGNGDRIRIPIFNKKEVVNFNESVQNSTFKNLKHIVLPKEGKYRIAKQYGMSVEELEALNPEMGTLKPGQVLNVKNPKAKKEKKEEKNDGFLTYEVKPKETFYSLTRQFQISKDSLEQINPQLAKEGLEAGMTLKIPKPDYMESDTLKVGKTSIIQLENYITNTSEKRIAIMLPFNLHEFKKDSVNKKEQIKSDRILRISLDFYSGVVAAIDSVEHLGIPVKAKFFDTQQSKNHIESLLTEENFQNYHAVIGPLLSSNLEAVSKKLNPFKIPVLSPLTNGELEGEENLFQTRPSSIVMEKALVTYIDSLKEGKNILILTDQKHTYLRNKLSYRFPEAKVIQQKNKEYLQREDLINNLSKEQENWIVLESDELGLISNATSYLNSLVDEYDIRLFTSNKSEPYDDEVSNQYLSNLKFTYASIAAEYSKEPIDSFVKNYVANYGITPSKYAVRGFDITYDLLLRMATSENLIESIEREGTTEYVENRFNYHKKMIGGYFNDAVFLIQYEKNLELKVLN